MRDSYFNLDTKKIMGYLFGLGFCLATALSVTMIHSTATQFDPFFSLFLTTVMGILYFNVVNLTKVKNIYQTSAQHKSLWLVISLFVAGNWIMSFYALSKINPFAYIFTYFSASAIVGATFGFFDHRKKLDLMVIAAMLILLFIFIDKIAFLNTNSHATALGLIGAVLSAFCGYGYRRSSVVFSQKTKLSATAVLAIRFFLLLLVALLFAKTSEFHLFNLNLVLHFILLAAVTFLIPLYCMQRSVLSIGADYFSILTSLCPAATALLLLCFYHVHHEFYFLLSMGMFGVSFIKLIR